MPHIRKAQAGSDSFGNVWEHDGDVVEVPHEQAEQLLAIDDGQFALADASDDEQQHGAPGLHGGNAAGEGKTTTVDDGAEPVENPEFSELVPKAPVGEPASDGADAGTQTVATTEDTQPVADAAKPAAPAKKTAARKTAASKTQE